MGELRTGRTIEQSVARALQFAMSNLKGMLYLAGASEVMAEEIEPYQIDQGKYRPIRPAAFLAKAVSVNVEAIVSAIVRKYSQDTPVNIMRIVHNWSIWLI